MAIPFREHLAGPYDALVPDVMQSAIRNQVVERLWSKDHRLWKPEPTEIADRLGWLTLPGDMLAHVQSLKTLAVTARKEGIRDVVLLGMGGSSLGPEVFRASFGSKKGAPRLLVLDSTVPGWVCLVTHGCGRSITERHSFSFDPDPRCDQPGDCGTVPRDRRRESADGSCYPPVANPGGAGTARGSGEAGQRAACVVTR